MEAPGMFKRGCILLLLLIGLIVPLMAGDVATYVNLGFSVNSRYFLFGYYGIDDKTSNPYANMYLVDVHANEFVTKGRMRGIYPVDVSAGQDGSGALYTLFAGNIEIIKQYGIDHLRSGRIVYVLVNGAEPKSHLEFRDFERNSTVSVDLIQAHEGTGDTVRSAFHLKLKLKDADGNSRDYVVGLPDYYRPGVKRYRIKQVCYSPDETSLVFIIEREELDGEGADIRYMVETVRIR
jgi:predicted secreted protein